MEKPDSHQNPARPTDLVDMAKLEGLAIGLEQRGEKSAAHQVRWAYTEIERLRAIIAYMGEMSLAPTVVRLHAEIKRLRAGLKEILDMWHRGHTVRIGEVARRALERKS